MTASTSTVRHEAIACPLAAYPIRLHPGEELKSTLTKFVEEHGLKAAFVLSAVGSVTKATIRFANSTTIATKQGPFEIVSLVGTLSAGGHLHVSLSDKTGNVIGGHVVGDMEIFTTAEVVIGDCEGAMFRRPYDPQTGYDELAISATISGVKS